MVRKGRTDNSIRYWDEVYENEKKRINIAFGYTEVNGSQGEVSRVVVVVVEEIDSLEARSPWGSSDKRETIYKGSWLKDLLLDWQQSTILSQLIQMLISFVNTLTDTTRNNR